MSDKNKKSIKESLNPFDLEVEKADHKLQKKTAGDSNNNKIKLPSDDESICSLDYDFHKPDKKKKSKKSKDQKPTTSNKRKLLSDNEDSDVLIDDESDYEKPKPKKSKKSKKSTSEDRSPAKPTKTRKVKAKDLKIVIDPASKVKTDTHKHKLVYKGQIFYCNYLPENFQAQLDGIIEMRKSKTAEVDLIGAGSQFDKNEKNDATKRYQIVCAIILSSQTADKQVDIAMKNLRNYGLTVSKMCNTDPDYILKNLIPNIGFNGNKAKYLREVAEICRDSYNGDVPRTKAEMLTLPGVGKKVANLAMYYCWKEICGVAVDTHCSRIMDKLGWTTKPQPGKKPTPDKQASEIESWLPKAMWHDLNELLVGFGQEICSSSKPKCDECLINKLCPWRLANW